MGLMKSKKVGAITADAKSAYDAGSTHFVARYWDEVMKFQGTGSVSGLADAIENVEAAGWTFSRMAYAWVEKKNRGVTILVFSRSDDNSGGGAQQPVPQPAADSMVMVTAQCFKCGQITSIATTRREFACPSCGQLNAVTPTA